MDKTMQKAKKDAFSCFQNTEKGSKNACKNFYIKKRANALTFSVTILRFLADEY